VLLDSSAVVLVLLPGGTFTMGAQADDPSLPNHDPAARTDEGPVHEVTLAPFFMGKYEFTQGQWGRFRRANPSAYGPDRKDFGVSDILHPVEQVSWDEAARVLGQLGLVLPTEAQWEYAARAGTTSVWWPGDEREALIGVANLADRSASRIGATWDSIKEWPALDDGFPVHARVGSLAANAFGLHDVHGNVLEWCRDWHGAVGTYELEPEPGSGLRKPINARYHVYRGGGFIYSASAARSAYRDGNVPAYKGSSIGLRASRALDP
jgi:formylglycine-generating enzyme required for sulfatase activity